ncbi:MAG: HAD family phosphatase [Bdellovibrionota bacterium]
MSSKIETILFDLDGTLVDTEKAASVALTDLFNSWNISIVSEDANFITGRTWAAAFDYFYKKYPIPVPRETALDEVMKIYRAGLERNLPIVPGSVAAVQSLARSFKLALVSGSYRNEILWALRKLKIESHFAVILGAEDYSRGKPAPDPYLSAIQLLKTKPQASLVFEDSQAGITSALSAGTWVIAVTGTNHFAQDHTRAHHHITNLTNVTPEWVHQVSKKFQAK